jgi:glycosyltransferase involved in cell wall biosynthesis
MKGRPDEDSIKKESRIAYDARLSLGQFRGMGHYLRQLIAGREQDLLGLCASGETDPSLKIVSSGFSFYPLWEQWSIPKLVRGHKVKTFIAPYNTAPLFLPKDVKLVMVVYDLIFMDRAPLSRSLYQNFGRQYRRFVVPRAIQLADVVLTCSHYSAQQIVSRFSLDSSKIRVIPCSLGEGWFSSESAGPGNSRYILAVAGEAPSKNLSRALDAFAHCRKLGADPSLRLKVAGVKERFHPIFQNQARQLGIAEFVDFLCYIPDVEMRSLYQQADLFVMPSLAEGFGIPVLEAMASGVPVAASSSTCLQEVGGEAARYFDPFSVEDMASTMRQILADPALRATMSEQGRMQSRKFHPHVVREQISSFWAEFERAGMPALDTENALW